MSRPRFKIQVQRIYEAARPFPKHGYLVDRLWPRGIKKSELAPDRWIKDVAPSEELRRWFGHDPSRWEKFVESYFDELDENADAWRPLLEAARKPRGVILLYASRDSDHNNAVALARYLERQQAEK